MNPPNPNVMNPITEDDIADYLSNTPDFFERHAQLLSHVQLTSPHGNRAVSLQERQAEMLREKIKALEHRLMDMVRHGTENVVTADRLQRWTKGLLTARDPRALPYQIASELQSLFLVPQTAIKVWDCDSAFMNEDYAQGVSDDSKALATSLSAPYCGLNSGFEAARWLAEPQAAVSIAMIPLRAEPEAPAFGMLVLASPDAQRYNADMGTDFLERMSELASSALSRLRP
ncbi:MAG: DUF484 family protein [Gammaproteobacteria bacterium]|nr:DUF484 family protein [Gammaproteobacteria bacterium]MBU1440511.1 DUF484 family protein [Gammaproteobacteria bacterium]MBU2409420.1 DUF484 family protein [Gammaproteobacteria bacterium]